MSTRTCLMDESGSELAEGLGLPLCWISLLSSGDLSADLADSFQVHIAQKDAAERLSNASHFLESEFSDVPELRKATTDFIAHLKKRKAKTLTIDMTDPICMDTDNFINALTIAVAAIESSDSSAKLRVGRYTFKSTREVLCYLTTLDPDNGVADREQLIGDLW